MTHTNARFEHLVCHGNEYRIIYVMKSEKGFETFLKLVKLQGVSVSFILIGFLISRNNDNETLVDGHRKRIPHDLPLS